MKIQNQNLTLEDLKQDRKLTKDFVDFFLGFKLYDYQLDFLMACLKYNRVVGRFPRQSGKSQVVAIYVLLRAIFKRTIIIIVAPTQSQSDLMYKKIQDLVDFNPDIKLLVKNETKTRMDFNTGSRVISLPSGQHGRTILGHTADVIIAEEAGILTDDLVNRILFPMLASKGVEGQMIKIGTPLLVGGHFYHSNFKDTNFKVIAITYKEVLKAGQYTKEFIEEQKANLTSVQFQTEYESKFISSSNMFFKPELLEICTADYPLINIF